MRTINPVSIPLGSSKVTSSTVVETAPSAYSAGTTYASGAQVGVSGSAGLVSVYQSLQNGNTGNAPASSPTWWVLVNNTYQEYAGGTTYALGDNAQDSATIHKVYISLQAGNVGHALTDTTWWAEVGPTNKWAMYDLLRNTQTSAYSSFTTVFTPGARCDTVALSGLVGTAVRISATSVTGGGTVFDTNTVSLVSRTSTGWYDYFFKPFKYRTEFVRHTLPPYSDLIITVTVTNTGGTAACGSFVAGMGLYLGTAQWSPKNEALNFSTVTRDSFGNSLLVAKRNVPRISLSLEIPKANVDDVLNTRSLLNGAVSAWFGLDDDTDGYFNSVFIVGYYRELTLDLAYPTYIKATLILEEV